MNSILSNRNNDCMQRISSLIIFLLLVATINSEAQQGRKRTSRARTRDILASNIDTLTKPADDFFQFANGGWLKKNPIPPEESSWGIGNAVREEIYSRLRIINEKALAEKASGGLSQRIGDFWFTAMDTITIEKQGIKPLQPELDKINRISSIQDLMNLVAAFYTKGIASMFAEGIGQDAKMSDRMAVYIGQGGIGLPNRDYYFNTDARTVKIRTAYLKHLNNVFRLLGYKTAGAAKAADAIMQLETSLAAASRKLEALRDPYANYNKMAVSDLQTLTPSINWPLWLKNSGITTGIDSVIVGQPEFLTALEKALTSTPLTTWKDYLRWNMVRTYAAYLSKAFVDENFSFYGKVLRGAQKPRARWKRVLDAEENVMGEALGQLFVKEYFNETAKKRYEDMVEAIRLSLKERIEQLPWMSDGTKQKALVKLAAIQKKVGYPDKWKDFTSMKIDRSAYVLNIISASQWWNQYQINKLGKPVDRTEWDMTPQTYNAYYNPSNNEIVLPAGIFTVPGFRDEQLDDALVYGYAGASTIGHEITHGFDDEGRQFDEAGNLKNWWTKEDEEKFKKRADVMVEQFNAYIPVDTLHINGAATLGENIADLGGVLLGLDAYKKTEEYKNGKKKGGFTPIQRYFLGYALGWLGQARKESLANQVLTDVHAPAKYRVNGPFVNVDDFFSAFDIKPTDKMYREESKRVKIW
jgi:putative endopeptidase